MFNTKSIAIILAFSINLIACGGLSGVDVNAKLENLSETQKNQVCEWNLGLYGGENFEIQCENGKKLHGDSIEQCAKGLRRLSGDGTTVGEYELCMEYAREQLCNFEAKIWDAPECAPFKDVLSPV